MAIHKCPFCGGEGILSTIGYGDYYIQCRECGACSGIYVDNQKAVDSWNKRYEPFTPGGISVPSGNDRFKKR